MQQEANTKSRLKKGQIIWRKLNHIKITIYISLGEPKYWTFAWFKSFVAGSYFSQAAIVNVWPSMIKTGTVFTRCCHCTKGKPGYLSSASKEEEKQITYLCLTSIADGGEHWCSTRLCRSKGGDFCGAINKDAEEQNAQLLQQEKANAGKGYNV